MRTFLVILLLAAAHGLADVVSYEGVSFPELDQEAWIHLSFCTPERWLENEWLHQEVQPGECDDPPFGDEDTYIRSLAAFNRVPTFFVEARLEVQGSTSEFPWGGPVALNAWSQGPQFYGWTISTDQVRFVRDSFDEIVYAAIEPGVHTHRLELYGDQLYLWIIDGVTVHSNVPGGQYPSANPSIGWRAKSAYLTSHIQIDYVRYGTIPLDATGDFDSGGQVDSFDFYFFHECLTMPSGSWAGCSWVDMDSDGSTTCDDWIIFKAAWTDPSDPPGVPQCDCPTDLTTDGTTNAFDLAQLLGAWGPNPDGPSDINNDELVNASDLALLLGSWGPCK